MCSSTSSFYCWKQKYELTASLAIPLSAWLLSQQGVTVWTSCHVFKHCRGNAEINVLCFGVLSVVSLLTPPPLLVKSGQWKLFLASVCQTSPWDYLRSSRLCLENVFSIISMETCSVQKAACDEVRIPTAVYKQNTFTSTGLCFFANLLCWGKLYLKMILTDMFSFGRFISGYKPLYWAFSVNDHILVLCYFSRHLMWGKQKPKAVFTLC